MLSRRVALNRSLKDAFSDEITYIVGPRVNLGIRFLNASRPTMTLRRRSQIITQTTYRSIRPLRPFRPIPFLSASMSRSIVVGGSLGGLLTGIALKRLGHTVTILERSPTPLLQDQGAGIVAGGNTLEFLNKFDKSGRDVAVVSPVRHYLNQKGEEIDRKDWEQKMTRSQSLGTVLP